MKFREEIIGDCRLILGNCLEVMPTLDAVSHVICDPPYEKEAHRKDRRVMRKTGLVAGALTFDAITESIREKVCVLSAEKSQGWMIYFCQAEAVSYWRDAIEAAGARYKAPMIWVKPDGMPQFNGQGPGMGFESMTAGWAGKGVSKWNGGGKHGVFIYNKGESERNVHETQKPLALMKELIRLFTNESETVCDPFMGSATTVVACVRMNRKFVGIELDEKYFSIACRRIEEAYRQPDMFVQPPAKPVQDKML